MMLSSSKFRINRVSVNTKFSTLTSNIVLKNQSGISSQATVHNLESNIHFLDVVCEDDTCIYSEKQWVYNTMYTTTV